MPSVEMIISVKAVMSVGVIALREDKKAFQVGTSENNTRILNDNKNSRLADVADVGATVVVLANRTL